jgi:isopropylmalate/homocitrate/citramalate synthase
MPVPECRVAETNTLAAVDAGARQIECTINGIGERATSQLLSSLTG